MTPVISVSGLPWTLFASPQVIDEREFDEGRKYERRANPHPNINGL